MTRKERRGNERKVAGNVKILHPHKQKNEGRGMWVRAVIGSVKAVANRQVNS